MGQILDGSSIFSRRFGTFSGSPVGLRDTRCAIAFEVTLASVVSCKSATARPRYQVAIERTMNGVFESVLMALKQNELPAYTLRTSY